MYNCLEIALERIGDDNVLPDVYIRLVFMVHVMTCERAIRLLEIEFPWDTLVKMLNFLIKRTPSERFAGDMFPVPERGYWEAIARRLHTSWAGLVYDLFSSGVV